MTTFLDLRALSGGGGLSNSVVAYTGTSVANYAPLSLSGLEKFIYGKHVLIGTHGFNVNRSDGITTLSTWESLLELPDSTVFLGLLWPGDSESVHALAYPTKPAIAMGAGTMAGSFVDQYFASATGISFVSHSLGARVILQAIVTMERPVAQAIVMAGAVNDDCLTNEFSSVPGKVKWLSLLASKEDEVLKWAFPIGDFVAEIMGREHPWWESALGRYGPVKNPPNFVPPFLIPDEWNYGHGSYLQTSPSAAAPMAQPATLPASGPMPQSGASGWQQAWSAAFVSSRFR